jgi:CheY-like chemotaxis protein
MAAETLRNSRILVVEDEYLLAVMLQEWLEGQGCVVVGPVPSVEKALNLIESDRVINAAIVDVNLGGTFAYPVADGLLARKIPFVFTSGYEDDVLHTRYPKIRNCQKPYLLSDMQEALTRAMSA